MAKTTMSETLFPVTEVPAVGIPKTVADERQLGSEIDSTGYKFIVREDTGEIMSCMTDDYRLVTNKSLIDVASPILKKEGATLRECSVYNDGKKTVWRWLFPETKVDIGGGDLVSPEVCLINSYDGSAEIQARSGAYRLVCSNGLIIGVVLSRTKNKHVIWNTNLDKIDDSIHATILATKDVLVNSLPLLKETNIRKAHIKKVIEMLPTYAIEALTQYLIANNPDTYWDLLNAMTYISTHHMQRDRGATLKLENEIYPSIIKLAKTENKAIA